MAKGNADVYTQTVYEHLHPLFANWEPSRPVQLGDFGLLEDKIFHYLGNITRKFGIKFQEVSAGGADHRQFCSDEDYEIESHAKGTYKFAGALNAKAMLQVKFRQAKAVFFNAAGCGYTMVGDKVALGKKILDLHANNPRRWKKEWVIVTDLVGAASTTVIITTGESGDIMFEATGDVDKIDLADASIGFKMRTRKKVGYHVVADSDRNPLLGLSKIQPRFLWFGRDFKPILSARNALELTAELETASRVWTRKSSEDFYFGQVL